MTIFFQHLFSYSIIAQICCYSIVIAEEKTSRNIPLVHQQQLIATWERKIKNIDPNSPESKNNVLGLIRLLKDKHFPMGLRQQAALTLGRIGKNGTDAIPLMVQILSTTKNEQERIGLLKALSLYGQYAKPATSIGISIVRDDFATVTERRAAMALLSRIGIANQRAILALNNSLQIQVTKKNRLSLSDAALLRQTAAEAVAYLGANGNSAIPILNRLLQDDDEGVRRKAVVALGAIGKSAEITFPGLLDVMANDDSLAVQDEAMYAIAKIGPKLLPSLKLLLKEKDVKFRRRIVISICKMGTYAKPMLPHLVKLLQDQDSEIRINCAESIWLISKKSHLVISASLELLENKNRQIRKRAAQLLIDLDEEVASAIPHLKKLQQNKRSEVRQAASYVLRKTKLLRSIPK